MLYQDLYCSHETAVKISVEPFFLELDFFPQAQEIILCKFHLIWLNSIPGEHVNI